MPTVKYQCTKKVDQMLFYKKNYVNFMNNNFHTYFTQNYIKTTMPYLVLYLHTLYLFESDVILGEKYLMGYIHL